MICNEKGKNNLINNEHDVIRFMKRFPDKIISNTERMKAKVWKCSICKTEFKFEQEIPIPSPCNVCNGIFFEKININ